MKISGGISIVGYIGIKPVGTLRNTAELLGKDLCVEFFEDTEGRYDEYPAYCAEALGLELALLGVPPEEYDIRENKTEDYVLQIKNILSVKSENQIDISDFILSWLRTDSTLDCWILD